MFYPLHSMTLFVSRLSTKRLARSNLRENKRGNKNRIILLSMVCNIVYATLFPCLRFKSYLVKSTENSAACNQNTIYKNHMCVTTSSVLELYHVNKYAKTELQVREKNAISAHTSHILHAKTFRMFQLLLISIMCINEKFQQQQQQQLTRKINLIE